MDTGLMQPQASRTTTQGSNVLEAFRAMLAPFAGEPTNAGTKVKCSDGHSKAKPSYKLQN